MIDKFETSMPVFRAAIEVLRDLARALEGGSVTLEIVVGTIDTAADQCENLIDHLEKMQ